MNWNIIKKSLGLLIYVSQFIIFLYLFFIQWGWNIKSNFSELIAWFAVEMTWGVYMFKWLSELKTDYAKKNYEATFKHNEYEKLKQEKAKNLRHFNKLAEELERRIHTNIKFTSDLDREKLHLQLSDPNLTQTTSEYSDDLNNYLENENKNLWENIIKIEPAIVQHNLCLKVFLDNLNLNILKEVEETVLNIKEHDENSTLPKPLKYYTRNLFTNIVWYVQFNYIKRIPFIFCITPVRYPEGLRYALELDGHLVVSDNKAEIEEIETKLLCVFNDNIANVEFIKLKEDFEEINSRLSNFKEEAPKVINNLKRGRFGNYKPNIEGE